MHFFLWSVNVILLREFVYWKGLWWEVKCVTFGTAMLREQMRMKRNGQRRWEFVTTVDRYRVVAEVLLVSCWIRQDLVAKEVC